MIYFPNHTTLRISKVSTDDLIRDYNNSLKRIDIHIPKGKLRVGYLREL